MHANNIVSEKMPTLKLTIGGKTREFKPNDDNAIVMQLSDTRTLVITVKNIGNDNQVEDFMYTGEYTDKDGNTMAGKHVFGSYEHMTSCLTTILNMLHNNGIKVL